MGRRLSDLEIDTIIIKKLSLGIDCLGIEKLGVFPIESAFFRHYDKLCEVLRRSADAQLKCLYGVLQSVFGAEMSSEDGVLKSIRDKYTYHLGAVAQRYSLFNGDGKELSRYILSAVLICSSYTEEVSRGVKDCLFTPSLYMVAGQFITFWMAVLMIRYKLEGYEEVVERIILSDIDTLLLDVERVIEGDGVHSLMLRMDAEGDSGDEVTEQKYEEGQCW